MKPFDDKFADKVREVFDRHDEPFDSAAWVSMQARLRARRKARIIALLSVVSKAAAVLLLLGGMTWLAMFYFFPGQTDMAERVLRDEAPTPSAGATIAEDSDDPVSPADETVAMVLPAEVSDDPPSAIDVTGVGVLLAEDTNDRLLPTGKTGAGVDKTTAVSDQMLLTDPARGPLDGHSGHAVVSAEQETPDPILTDPSEMAQVESAGTSDTLSLVGITTEPSYEYSTPERYQDRDVLSGPPVNGAGVSSAGRLQWSVMAGSMLTYAEQQLASGLGFSGGVMSEYRASSLFSLSSGVALAYQQFEVDGMPLRQKLSRSEFDYLPDQFSARTVGNQSYELLALDIPLNVQYYFHQVSKSQWYVSAGFSSLLYLQQRVSGTEIAYITADYYDAALGSNRSMSYVSEIQTESNYDAFAHFDFARLLNLSVGYEIKQEKSVTIIEPFIKYPLGTLSSRNIKMGMGGVRMRLRFGH